jgi:Fe-S-cluster containining protein
MSIVNLRSFKQRVRHRKRAFRRFLSQLEKDPPKKLDQLASIVEKDAWREVNCLSCGNCCKTMTPTFKEKDMKRISAHLNMTVQAFKDKWLYKQRGTGDWLNKSTPCQFLDLDTNMCSIYEVRPADCAGFPHFSKKKMVYYLHTHKQNLEYCPATYRMVERMMEKLKRPPAVD